eukprot:9366946-Lingulodinium_polyedra.AAC.1
MASDPTEDISEDYCPRCPKELKPFVAGLGDRILKCEGWNLAESPPRGRPKISRRRNCSYN